MMLSATRYSIRMVRTQQPASQPASQGSQGSSPRIRDDKSNALAIVDVVQHIEERVNAVGSRIARMDDLLATQKGQVVLELVALGRDFRRGRREDDWDRGLQNRPFLTPSGKFSLCLSRACLGKGSFLIRNIASSPKNSVDFLHAPRRA